MLKEEDFGGAREKKATKGEKWLLFFLFALFCASSLMSQEAAKRGFYMVRKIPWTTYDRGKERAKSSGQVRQQRAE